MRSRFYYRIAFAALAASSLSSPIVHAQVVAPPNSINFQGRLATPSGNPVADGTYNLVFNFYDAVTGGTRIGQKVVNSVPVKNGTFAAKLDSLPATLFNGNVWVAMIIGNGNELAPRIQILSVPYAFKADIALTVPDSSITNAKLAGNITADKFAANIFNPLAWLLGGNSGTNGTQFLGTTDNQPLVFKTNNAERMRILSGGNIGIGTATPASKVHIVHTSPITLHVESSSTTGTWLKLLNTSAGGHDWNIISTGSNNGEGAGSLLFFDFNAPAPRARLLLHANGMYVEGGLSVSSMPFGDYKNVQWNEATKQLYHDNSSRKHKRDIMPLVDDFDLLLKAQSMTYTRPNAPGRWEIGFIAEDFDSIGLKKLVDYGKNGEVEGINYEKICLYLTEIAKRQSVTLQNQGVALEKQRKEIDTLKAQMENLTQMIERDRR